VKKIYFILTMFFLLFASNIYGQTATIRLGSSIGYCSADDMNGLSHTSGLKILLMANEFQRYGVKIDILNVSPDDKHSYLSTGLFIEQVVFNYFNMGIGTVGYINTKQKGENPFGLYSHLGFEYNFNKSFVFLLAYQSEFIFRKQFTSNNALLFETGYKF